MLWFDWCHDVPTYYEDRWEKAGTLWNMCDVGITRAVYLILIKTERVIILHFTPDNLDRVTVDSNFTDRPMNNELI